MQEQDGLAVRANLGLAIAKNACAGGSQAIARRDYVIHLVAHMMHATGRILLEKGCYGRIGAERLQKFHLCVAEINKHHGDAMFRKGLRRRNRRTQRVAVGGRSRGKFGNRDGDMDQATEHESSRIDGNLISTTQGVARSPGALSRLVTRRSTYCVTNTVTKGFLPHTSLAAARTARRTDSCTRSRSFLRWRGMESTAPTAASSMSSS